MTDREDAPAGEGEKKGGCLPPGLLVTLEVLAGPDRGLRYAVKSGRVTIGRKDADFKLTDPTVSGLHAQLECAGGRLFLTDLSSTNGTKVNGERIESSPVVNRDEIQVGETRLLLSAGEDRDGEYQPETDEEDTGESRLQPSASILIAASLPNPELPPSIHIVLEAIDGPDRGQKLRVARRSTVIGRGPSADFILTDPATSTRHCQLEVHNKDKMTLKDLASSNGTRLNDSFISVVKIRNGDLIQIGATQIRILIHLYGR